MDPPDPKDPSQEVHVVAVTLPEAVVEAEPPLEELPILGPEHVVHEPEPVLPELVDFRLPSPEPDATPSQESAEDLAEAHADPAGDYRKLYAAEFSLLDRNLRVATAREARGASLLALCLDTEPAVIAAVFENTQVGLEHARLAALHHKNPAGLEHVVKRADFLRDARVQRQLLKNSQLTESLFRRILGGKPLREIYKVALDREVPERTRVGSRALLRARFASADAEERAAFIVSNEARSLALLIGQTFDQKTTAILCARQYNSVMFVQNLARFPACPPVLLAHLLKQPFVRRHVALKKMLFQHPNLPTQLKRDG